MWPLPIMPPLRVLAPLPGSPASRTATLRPARAAVKAADSPVNPAPTMATSAVAGRGASARGTGGAAAHHQGSKRMSSPGMERLDRLGVL